MKIQTLVLAALATGLLFTTQQASAAEAGSSIQALLGAVRYDDFTIEDTTGTGTQTVDISTLPQLGGAWSTAPKGDRLQFGLECSFLLGFSFGSANYTDDTTGSYVRIDYDVWTFDLAGGGYANLFLGEGDVLRLYVAGGPMIMPILSYSEGYKDGAGGNDSYYRNSESAFSYGLYARAGLEFRIQEAGMLGVGVRGTWVDTDLGSVDTLAGLGAFVTFTAGL